MLRPIIERKSIVRTNTVIISRAITILAIDPPYGQFQKNRKVNQNLKIFLVWDPTPMASFSKFKE
jgi:hypothetical protein